jgi:AcrR family transcriptional regulator
MAGRPTPDGQRERILECAERLVASRGFEKVRLRDVAKGAKVSIGSLQHHFETRDGLLRETFLWSAQRRVDRWRERAVTDGTPWEKLVELLVGPYVIERYRENATIWLEFAAAASRDPELQTTMADLYDQWRAPIRGTIEEGLAEGVFKLSSAPVETVLDILTTQIDGAEVASTIHASGTDSSRLCYLTVAAAELLLNVAPKLRVSQKYIENPAPAAAG